MYLSSQIIVLWWRFFSHFTQYLCIAKYILEYNDNDMYRVEYIIIDMFKKESSFNVWNNIKYLLHNVWLCYKSNNYNKWNNNGHNHLRLLLEKLHNKANGSSWDKLRRCPSILRVYIELEVNKYIYISINICRYKCI